MKYIIQAKSIRNNDVYIKHPISLNFERARERMRYLLNKPNIKETILLTERGDVRLNLVKN